MRAPIKCRCKLGQCRPKMPNGGITSQLAKLPTSSHARAARRRRRCRRRGRELPAATHLAPATMKIDTETIARRIRKHRQKPRRRAKASGGSLAVERPGPLARPHDANLLWPRHGCRGLVGRLGLGSYAWSKREFMSAWRVPYDPRARSMRELHLGRSNGQLDRDNAW